MCDNVGQKWKKVFEQNTSLYRFDEVDRKFFERIIRSPYIQKIIEYAKLNGSEEILEAGCGSGRFSVCLAILGYKVVALDFSSQALENTERLTDLARKYYGRLAIRTVKQDLERLNLANECFDVTFNEGVVEHWMDKKQRVYVISEMVRVTKKGGSVIIYVPNGRHILHPWWKLSRYPPYFGLPQMVCYDTTRLKQEMKMAGLVSIGTDGIDAFLSLGKWPTNKALSYFPRILQKGVPLPRQIREKFGLNLVGLGRKSENCKVMST